MFYIMNKKDNEGDFNKKPKEITYWWSWIPAIGYFLPRYPCHNVTLDIYQGFWCIVGCLIIISSW